jgi:hypothetical protein
METRFLLSLALIIIALVIVQRSDAVAYQARRVRESHGSPNLHLLDARLLGWSHKTTVELFNAYQKEGVRIYQSLYTSGADVLFPFAYGWFGTEALRLLYRRPWRMAWMRQWHTQAAVVAASFDLLENLCIYLLQAQYLDGNTSLQGLLSRLSAFCGGYCTVMKYIFFSIATGIILLLATNNVWRKLKASD